MPPASILEGFAKVQAGFCSPPGLILFRPAFCPVAASKCCCTSSAILAFIITASLQYVRSICRNLHAILAPVQEMTNIVSDDFHSLMFFADLKSFAQHC